MHTDDHPCHMQRPAAGCANCGGTVRTRKPVHGWTCAACVREIERSPRP